MARHAGRNARVAITAADPRRCGGHAEREGINAPPKRQAISHCLHIGEIGRQCPFCRNPRRSIMGYLDLISHLDTTDSGNGSGYDKNDLNDKTSYTCSCGRRLALAESKEVGKCARCQSEGEFIRTLAPMRTRRERTFQTMAAPA